MTRSISYREGEVAWVDLTTTDLDRSGRFYGELFGWDITDLGEEAGGYRFGEIAGRPVAGLLAADPDQPIETWTVYLAVDDVEASVERAEAAGGHLLVAPYELDEHGRYALLADPGGAVFGLWQGSDHGGTQVRAFAGNPAWFENHTKGYDAACAFYGEAFGLEVEPFAEDDGFRYSTGRIADADGPAFGLFDVAPGRSATLPSMWAVYFLTADADRDAERAVELGATLTFGPAESVYGRMATLVDPLGAAFNLIEPMPMQPADEEGGVADAEPADEPAADEPANDDSGADAEPVEGDAQTPERDAPRADEVRSDAEPADDDADAGAEAEAEADADAEADAVTVIDPAREGQAGVTRGARDEPTAAASQDDPSIANDAEADGTGRHATAPATSRPSVAVPVDDGPRPAGDDEPAGDAEPAADAERV